MKLVFAFAVGALTATAAPAGAQSHQEIAAQRGFTGSSMNGAAGGATGGALSGATAGAIGGAIVGGPVGAVVGGVGGAVVGGATGGVIGSAITPEDRIYVRRYVEEREVAPVMMRDRVVVGRPLPRTVRTYRIDDNPRMSSYRYARINDDYFLVDARGNVIGTVD